MSQQIIGAIPKEIKTRISALQDHIDLIIGRYGDDESAKEILELLYERKVAILDGRC